MNTKNFIALFDWLPKSTIKAGESLNTGRFPFFTSSSQQKKWIDTFQYSNEALILGTGGSPSIHYINGKFSVSTDCVVAIATDTEINVKYVYYFLKSNIHLLERGFRGAGLKHISKSYIDSIDIVYPDIEEQNRIVTILDKIHSLVETREKTINGLESLLESIYLKMFGTLNSDFEDWDYVEIDHYKKNKSAFRTGPFGSALTHDLFTEEGDVAVLGIDNAVDNIFRWKKKRFISHDQFNQLKRYKINPRDVIVTIMGTVGRSAVIPDDVGLAINTKHLAALSLNENICNPYYLSYSIHTNPYIQHQIKARSRGSVMDGLNLSLLRQLKIKNAPIDQQNLFETVYKKIQQIKDRLLDFRQLSENLLNSFSQRIFSGQRIVELEIEVESLIDTINLLLPDDQNDITAIKSDKTYLQNLIDRLSTQDFKSAEQYYKGKYIAFRLLKEGNLIEQAYDSRNMTIKLRLK